MVHYKVSPACYFHIASAISSFYLFEENLSDVQVAFCDLVQTDAELDTTIHKLSYTFNHLSSQHFSALLLLWHTPDLSTVAPDLQKNVKKKNLPQVTCVLTFSLHINLPLKHE